MGVAIIRTNEKLSGPRTWCSFTYHLPVRDLHRTLFFIRTPFFGLQAYVHQAWNIITNPFRSSNRAQYAILKRKVCALFKIFSPKAKITISDSVLRHEFQLPDEFEKLYFIASPGFCNIPGEPFLRLVT